MIDLEKRQLRNLNAMKKSDVRFAAGDQVKVRERYVSMAKCYRFAAADYRRITGLVKKVYHLQYNDQVYVEVDFRQYQLPRRKDGLWHGENARPSKFMIGTKDWPADMLEKVR